MRGARIPATREHIAFKPTPFCLPTSTGKKIKNFQTVSSCDLHDLHPAPSDLPEGGGVEFRRVDVDGGEASGGGKLPDHGDDRHHNGKI